MCGWWRIRCINVRCVVDKHSQLKWYKNKQPLQRKKVQHIKRELTHERRVTRERDKPDGWAVAVHRRLPTPRVQGWRGLVWLTLEHPAARDAAHGCLVTELHDGEVLCTSHLMKVNVLMVFLHLFTFKSWFSCSVAAAPLDSPTFFDFALNV